MTAGPLAVPQIMLRVCLALLPGIAALTYLWGWGIIWNVVCCSVLCLVAEVLMSLLRRTTPLAYIKDGSTLVTALLLSICLPPFADVAVMAVAVAVAIGLVKHAYGGLGRNIFNPAMAGYAAILVSFPVALSQWPSPAEIDGFSGATLLTDFRYRSGLTSSEFLKAYEAAYSAQQLIAAAFLLGGIGLVLLKLIHWRVPAAVALGIAIAALFGYDQGASTSTGGWIFHLTAGGTLAAAFFVVTDPVTLPARAVHQWLAGATIGVLIYLIRAFGAYPDGIAFAVLLVNCATPLLDRYTWRGRAGEDNAEIHRG